MPVGLYVFIHSQEMPHPAEEVIHSPEWNIATIFLLAQGQALYRAELDRTGKRLSQSSLGLMGLAAATLLVLAASNIHWAFQKSTPAVIKSMWTLFGVVSTAFLGFISGAKLVAPTGGADE